MFRILRIWSCNSSLKKNGIDRFFSVIIVCRFINKEWVEAVKRHSGTFQFWMFFLGLCCLSTGCVIPIVGGAGFIVGLLSLALGIFLIWKKSFYYGKGVFVAYIIWGIIFLIDGPVMALSPLMDSPSNPMPDNISKIGLVLSGALMFIVGILLLYRAHLHKKWGFYVSVPRVEQPSNDYMVQKSTTSTKQRIPETVSERLNRENKEIVSNRPAINVADKSDFKDLDSFSMNDIDAISQISTTKKKGDLFEQYCARLLELNNFRNVQVVGGSGDLGADIIAWKGNRKFVIQCKCYQGSVPYHALEQTVTARKNVGAGDGIILTNSFFSEQTKRVAPDHQIYLWDKNRLQELIDTANEMIEYEK